MKKTLFALAFGVLAAISLAQDTPPATTTPNQTPQLTTPAPTGSGPSYRIEDIGMKFSLNNEDAAAAIALSGALKIDPATIVADKGSINATVYQLGPAFEMQQATGKSVADLYSMFQNGQTWMQIATANSVPVSAYNPTNVDTTSWTNDDFTSGVWQSILIVNYGLNADTMVYLSSGLHEGMNEVVVGAVVAREDNTPIRDVMNAYNQHSDWSAIEGQFAVNIHNPPNQSQVTTDTATTPQVAATPPPDATAEANPAPAPATENPPATTPDQTATSQPAIEALSPVEEWQISGGDINPYNGWAETTTVNTYALHRKHHRRMVHRKVRRRIIHHKMVHH